MTSNKELNKELKDILRTIHEIESLEKLLLKINIMLTSNFLNSAQRENLLMQKSLGEHTLFMYKQNFVGV